MARPVHNICSSQRMTWTSLGSKARSAFVALHRGIKKINKDRARWNQRRGFAQQRKVQWSDKQARRFASFIVGKKNLIAAGDVGNEKKIPFLASINIETGKNNWVHQLPAQPIKGGTAIDSQGRILVSLADGTVICHEAKKK